MKLPRYNAAAVAQALEWCGYGPAIAEDRYALLVRTRGLDFHLTLTRDGDIGGDGFAPMFNTYQNKLAPMVRAVLSVVHYIFCIFGGFSWFEGILEEDFGTTRFLARTTYLWLQDPKAEVPMRLVLNEFLIDGQAVRHQLQLTEYGNALYEKFYQHIGEMLLDFQENGRLPPNVTNDELNDLIMQCLPERSL